MRQAVYSILIFSDEWPEISTVIGIVLMIAFLSFSLGAIVAVIIGRLIYKRCSRPAPEAIYDEVGLGLTGSNDNH